MEVDELISKNDYVISGEDIEGCITIKNASDFSEWFFKVKPFDKKIAFFNVPLEVDRIYSFLNYYTSVKKLCETEMERYNDLFSKEDNKFLKEALEQFITINRGGKYLRASLIALGYHSFGKSDNDFLPLSIALEVFQTSILIHDDIIDMADKRRGRDTIPTKYQKIYSNPVKDDGSFNEKRKNTSDSMALCLGDLGFYLANQIMIKGYFKNPNLPFILDYYNNIAIKTCKGEMIDVILPFYEEFYESSDDLEGSIFEIYKLKTAWYSVIGPYVLGSILAGVSQDKIDKLESVLLNLGVAYQIKDDLLGIYGSEDKIGKSASSDAKEFKQTLLYCYTINTEYKDELLKYYGKSDLNQSDIDKIKDIFDKSGAKEYSYKIMDRLFDESFKDISSLDFLDEKYKNILLGFAEFLKIRSK